jgi:hypothetical protein
MCQPYDGLTNSFKEQVRHHHLYPCLHRTLVDPGTGQRESTYVVKLKDGSFWTPSIEVFRNIWTGKKPHEPQYAREVANAKKNGNTITMRRKNKDFNFAYLPHALLRIKKKQSERPRQRKRTHEEQAAEEKDQAKDAAREKGERPKKRARVDASEPSTGGEMLRFPPFVVSAKTMNAFLEDLLLEENETDVLTVDDWKVRFAAAFVHKRRQPESFANKNLLIPAFATNRSMMYNQNCKVSAAMAMQTILSSSEMMESLRGTARLFLDTNLEGEFLRYGA